jgi:hypothetical protein
VSSTRMPDTRSKIQELVYAAGGSAGTSLMPADQA